MKIPNISFPKFLLLEIRSFLFEWPSAIILFLAIGSSISLAVKGANLTELEKAIFGGIVSSFVFYIFIDFLPRVLAKRIQVLRFAKELQKCLDYANGIFDKLKGEWPKLNIEIDNESRFFHALSKQSIQYQPNSQNFRSIKGSTNTTPIQFIYNNLGEVLYSEYLRFKDRVIHLDRVGVATQLELWNIDSQLEIGAILDIKPSSIAVIQNLAHINNNAALFGTDLDMIYDRLIKIKGQIEKEFHLSW